MGIWFSCRELTFYPPLCCLYVCRWLTSRRDADPARRPARDPVLRQRRDVPGWAQPGKRPQGSEAGAPPPDRHVRAVSQLEGYAIQGLRLPCLLCYALRSECRATHTPPLPAFLVHLIDGNSIVVRVPVLPLCHACNAFWRSEGYGPVR